MEAVVLAIGVIVVLAAIFGVSLWGMNRGALPPPSPTAAIEAHDTWYRQSVALARALERVRNDPMVWPLVAEADRARIEKLLGAFWEEDDKP